MTAAAFALRAGDVFHGRYSVVRCIATGGMGAVYEVSHTTTRRRCALKVMLPSLVADHDLRARFQTEATIAAQIDSDHIVDVLDAGIDQATGTPFIVMELLIGEELCDRLVRSGPMPPPEALELLRQAALALDRTHAAGVIHRDLKPENFFLSVREDGAVHMKILDFGIAKVAAESAHGARQTGTMGTPFYMPPEQVDGTGRITFHADLYAFAQVSYAMLAGEPYFDEDFRAAGGVYGLLQRVMKGTYEPASQRAHRRRGVTLPASIDAWFAKGTARKAGDRFQSASAQVAALAEALGLPLVAPRAGVATGPDAFAAAMTGPYARVQMPGTVAPVASDAPFKRVGLAQKRWPLPVAATALAISLSVLVWLALDVSRPQPPASAGGATSSAVTSDAPVAAAASEAPTATAATGAAASTDAPASTAASAGSASVGSGAAGSTPAASGTVTKPRLRGPKPPDKRKSVLDVGP